MREQVRGFRDICHFPEFPCRFFSRLSGAPKREVVEEGHDRVMALKELLE